MKPSHRPRPFPSTSRNPSKVRVLVLTNTGCFHAVSISVRGGWWGKWRGTENSGGGERNRRAEHDDATQAAHGQASQELTRTRQICRWQGHFSYHRQNTQQQVVAQTLSLAWQAPRDGA